MKKLCSLLVIALVALPLVFSLGCNGTASTDDDSSGPLAGAEKEINSSKAASDSVSVNPKIAFSSNRDGNFEIYVMNLDGSGQTRLTNSAAADFSPAFSPDGTKIAYMSGSREGYDIYVMSEDGTGQTQLTREGGAYPTFSPDGTKIAFQSWRDDKESISIISVDGTGEARLMETGSFNRYPAFSPDGSKIVFTSTKDGSWDFYIMNVDGTGVTRLTENSAWEERAVFSQDGSQIAFMSKRYIRAMSTDGPFEVYVMNADGTGVTRLTDTSGGNNDPVFSPDGSMIAFSSWRDKDEEIYVMNTDGTRQTNLTNNPAMDISPSFPLWLKK